MMLTLRIPQTTDYSHLAIIFTTVLSQVYSEIFNIPIPPPPPPQKKIYTTINVWIFLQKDLVAHVNRSGNLKTIHERHANLNVSFI